MEHRLIRFKFKTEKAVNALAFLASIVSGLTKLKALKLLYFADKRHLQKYGRPIIGDIYYRLDLGPVPSKTKDIIDEVETWDDIEALNFETPNKDYFDEFLFLTSDKYPIISPKKEPDLEVFSDSDLEVLRETIQLYGKWPVGRLVDESHKDKGWKETPQNSEIDYRLFLDGLPQGSKKQLIETLESEQEDRDLFEVM